MRASVAQKDKPVQALVAGSVGVFPTIFLEAEMLRNHQMISYFIGDFALRDGTSAGDFSGLPEKCSGLVRELI